MFLQRSSKIALRRLAASAPVRRGFAISVPRLDFTSGDATSAEKKIKTFKEIKTEADLIPQGAAIGTVPTDMEQATGLERLEILGKMEGIDIFDLKPLDASRKGTMKDPIIVKSFGEEQYLGCTGYPADSHDTIWLTISKDRPFERCPECGSVYKMNFLGAPDDHHAHEHEHDAHGHDEHHPEPHKDPETMADYIKPEYRYV